MASHIIVQKFGSSVLTRESQLADAVDEIYRETRRGNRVVAVVSAFGQTTDQLQSRADAYGAPTNPSAVATLLATGEAQSAATLVMALERAGVPATLLDAAAAGLYTAGETLDARPVALDVDAMCAHLDRAPVVVLPGFIGRDREHGTTLLGRGGSDLTAIFVAQALGAECALFKDVNGLYDADPNTHIDARRYSTVSWETAAKIGGAIVQTKAVELAAECRQRFAIRTPRGHTGTWVGPFEDRAEETTLRSRARVALVGLGTVGLGVYRHLIRAQDRFEVGAILVRDPNKTRPADVLASLIHFDPAAFAARDYDVLVECAGGIDTAATLVAHALARGAHVVTANKELVAARGRELRARAQGDAQLRFAAAVGGAVPCLELAESSRDVVRISGVLNGTCNFVLDQRAEGASFEDAVRAAQVMGFAEADPSADIDGLDAARKLCLLVEAAFGAELTVADIAVRGIASLPPAPSGTGRWRLVAQAQRCGGEVRASVGPQWVDDDDPLGALRGEENLLRVEERSGKVRAVRGRGAGRWPTAQAVFADLLEVTGGARDAAARLNFVTGM